MLLLLLLLTGRPFALNNDALTRSPPLVALSPFQLGLSRTEFKLCGTAVKQLQYTLPLEAAQKVAELLSMFPGANNKRYIVNIVKRDPRALDIPVEDAVQKIDAIAAMLGVTRARALAAVAELPGLLRYRTATLKGKLDGIAAFTGV